jgi:hypothetical protein
MLEETLIGRLAYVPSKVTATFVAAGRVLLFNS